MRVFQSSYKDPAGVTHKTKTWYIEFVDHKETHRRVSGLTDRKQTEALGRSIQRLVWTRASGEKLDPVLTKWIESISPKLRTKLASFGILESSTVAALEPLVKHLDGEKDAEGKITFIGFRQALTAKGTGADHVELVATRAKKVIQGCGFKFWSDISASKVMSYINGRKEDRKTKNGTTARGISAQTFNFYLAAFKQFCRWMVRDGRASESPVLHLNGLNVRTDRRHDRRAISIDELRWLLETTRNGPERFGMTGPERSMLYRVAVETGLRRGELRSLTRTSFDLNDKNPTVTVAASYSKHRRQDVLPLRADTTAELHEFLACKMPGTLAFNVPKGKHDAADMFRADLAAARAIWLDKAGTPEERKAREATSFLTYVDAAGRFADFHSLRHTCGSLLASSGVHPKVAQSIMRHCTIDLTMSRYSHVFAGQEASAVSALPDLGRRASNNAMATGTDGRSAGHDETDSDGPGNNPRGPTRPRGRDKDVNEDGSKYLSQILAHERGFEGISSDSSRSNATVCNDAENTGIPNRYSGKSESNAPHGGVPEWLNGPVLKTGVPARVPWVRIPPLPVKNEGRTARSERRNGEETATSETTKKQRRNSDNSFSRDPKGSAKKRATLEVYATGRVSWNKQRKNREKETSWNIVSLERVI